MGEVGQNVRGTALKTKEMRIHCFFAISFVLSVALVSCKKHKENKVEPDSQYFKYVDTETLANDLVPLDMVRTADQGFLFLGSSPAAGLLFHKTYLLKLDKEGKFLWDKYLEVDFLNPVSELMSRNGAYFIFCMDQNTGTHLVKVNDANGQTESVKYWDNVQLPLHGSITPDGGFLMLNANLGDKWSGFTKINPDLSAAWNEVYFFNDNFAAEIDRHTKRETQPLPFMTGTVSGANPIYFFNCFYEANFSCIFVNPKDGKTDGYSQIGGDRSYATMRYLLPINENRFALCRYDRTNTNFLIPNATIPILGLPSVSTELGGISFADMEPNSRILCRRYVVAGKDVIIYAANNRNKGVGLYAFDANSGAFLGSKSLNLESPCEMGGFAPTADGGLAVLAKTYIVNRFPRVLVFKLSEEEAKKLVGG